MTPEIAKSAEKLCHFYEIANEGSLQSTARKLGVSAASLSKSLKQLEHAIGAKLFTRSKNGVQITDAGQKLLVFCRRYFRDIENVKRSIESPDDSIPLKIRVGTFQSIALYFWPAFIESMKPNPGVSFSIKTNRSKEILEALVRGDIDIALTVGTIKHKNLIYQEMYRDDYGFYVHHSWKIRTLEKLKAQQYTILYIPDATDDDGRSLRNYLHTWQLVFKDEFELDSLELIVDFVKRGYGVGILPTKVACAHRDSLVQLKIKRSNLNHFGRHRFFLSYRNDLEIPQNMMLRLIESAKHATQAMNIVKAF